MAGFGKVLGRIKNLLGEKTPTEEAPEINQQDNENVIFRFVDLNDEAACRKLVDDDNRMIAELIHKLEEIQDRIMRDYANDPFELELRPVFTRLFDELRRPGFAVNADFSELYNGIAITFSDLAAFFGEVSQSCVTYPVTHESMMRSLDNPQKAIRDRSGVTCEGEILKLYYEIQILDHKIRACKYDIEEQTQRELYEQSGRRDVLALQLADEAADNRRLEEDAIRRIKNQLAQIAAILMQRETMRPAEFEQIEAKWKQEFEDLKKRMRSAAMQRNIDMKKLSKRRYELKRAELEQALIDLQTEQERLNMDRTSQYYEAQIAKVMKEMEEKRSELEKNKAEESEVSKNLEETTKMKDRYLAGDTDEAVLKFASQFDEAVAGS